MKMDFKSCLVVLALALVAAAVESSPIHDTASRLNGRSHESHNETVGDMIGEAWGFNERSHESHDETVGDLIGEKKMLLDSDIDRRQLAGRPKYLSYEALKKNMIPCGQPGASYYNCRQPAQQANVYRRGCTVATRCARFNKP